jgi:hypothetical protein
MVHQVVSSPVRRVTLAQPAKDKCSFPSPPSHAGGYHFRRLGLQTRYSPLWLSCVDARALLLTPSTTAITFVFFLLLFITPPQQLSIHPCQLILQDVHSFAPSLLHNHPHVKALPQHAYKEYWLTFNVTNIHHAYKQR